VMSNNFFLASSVAEFGLLLTDSKYKGSASYVSAKSMAQRTLETDKEGYRKELVQLIEKAVRLKKEGAVVIADE
jgi:Ca-activated chloride channel family protein